MMINIYKIMSGTKAIIPSLFPGKEPAPNKGNKFRVWHQTEAVEGSSQQRDFGNRELGRHQGWAGKREEGVLQCQSCWGWNHLLLLSLEFPSWSRRGSKNADLAPAAFPWLEWSETSTTTASSSSGNPSWLSSLPRKSRENYKTDWNLQRKNLFTNQSLPSRSNRGGKIQIPGSRKAPAELREEQPPEQLHWPALSPWHHNSFPCQQPQHGHNSKPRARVSGFFPLKFPSLHRSALAGFALINTSKGCSVQSPGHRILSLTGFWWWKSLIWGPALCFQPWTCPKIHKGGKSTRIPNFWFYYTAPAYLLLKLKHQKFKILKCCS